MSDPTSDDERFVSLTHALHDAECEAEMQEAYAKDLKAENERLTAALKKAQAAFDRALPVIKWMKTLGPDTAGYSVANQVQPTIEKTQAEIAALLKEPQA